MEKLKLKILNDAFMVCRLDAAALIPRWATGKELVSITRTADELSIVCREGEVPHGVRRERGWRGFKVIGPFDLLLVGILSALTVPLTSPGVSVFTISTYDTDYLLVKAKDFERASGILTAEGHYLG